MTELQLKKQEEAIAIADYIIQHDCSTKEAAKHFGKYATWVIYRIDHQLRDASPDKYALIREGYLRHRKTKSKCNKYIWHFVCDGNPDAGYYFVKLKNDACVFAFADPNGYYWLKDGKDITAEVSAWIEPEQLIPKEWR